MKRVFLVLILAITLLAVAPIANAETPDQMRTRVIQQMFDKHPDFACVKNLPSFIGARNPTIDALAAEKKMDANTLQCYYWTWTFDRDVMGTQNPKGHYFRAGRTYTQFDYEDLYFRDLNAIVESLGFQVPFPLINDATDRPFHQWQRYPTQIIAE